MGRYSFFILSFCYRGHYVYADSSSSDVLLDSSSYVDDPSSGSTTDSQDGVLDTSNSVQQEESTSTSISEESSEESVSDSVVSDYEYYDFSSPFVYGNTNDESVNTGFMSRMSAPFASSGPGTVYSGPNNGWYIKGYFTGWSLDGTLNASQIANNIDMIVQQSRNSFSFVNSRLNGLENWKSSMNNLSSTVSSHTTQISNAFSRISQNEIAIDSLKTGNATNATNISTLFKNLGTVESSIRGLNTEIQISRDNEKSLSSAVTNVNNRATELSNRSDGLSARIGTLEAANLNLAANMSQEFEWTRTVLKQIKDSIDSMGTRFDTVYKNQVDGISTLVGEFGFLRTLITTQEGYTRDLLKDMKLESHLDTAAIVASIVGLHDTWKSSSYYTDIQETDGNSVKMIKGQVTRLINNISASDTFTRDLLKDMKSEFNISLGSINQYVKSIDSHMFSVRSNQEMINKSVSTEGGYIRDLLKDMKLESHLDTATIVASVVGLHDTWKSKDYMAGILEDDGDAVKLMKSVANKIGSSVSDNISLLRGVFGQGGAYWSEYDKRWNNFPLWLQGLLNNYFDHIYNMENKDSLLYRLVYFFIDEMTKTRDFVIEINDNVLIVNDSLLMIVDWLKMLYNKPPYSVTVTTPGFDFNRLKQILDGLNFGNIVNEAGTNIWDFLSELIKTLGDVLGTAISGLTDVAGKILDLLGDLINQIIKLIVPENLDFLDSGFDDIKSKLDIKFGSFLSLGTQVKEVVQPIDQDFKSVVSIDIMGAKFKPDFSLIDWVVVRFRTVMALSIWLSVAIYIYRKITGNGDLINDN